MKKEITYYANNNSMGDEMTDSDCNTFRDAAEKEIKKEYPNHSVTVSDEDSLQTVYTDDYENEEEIAAFCKNLWNRLN